MTASRLRDEIDRSILQRYGSLEDPDFGFVQELLARDPCAGLREALATDFEVEEATDPNDDVCCSVVLRVGGRVWLLQQSLLGPYAVLLRDCDGPSEVVADATATFDPRERLVLDLLERAGLQILDRATLERPVALELFNAEPDRVCVYQALFSDTDVLPWEAAP